MNDATSDTSKILIVEDEWLIAATLQQDLEELGYGILGPAPSVEVALSLLTSEPQLRAAILDVSLGSEKSFPVAHELQSRRVPFVFLSGYTHRDLPDEFSGVTMLTKPLAGSQLPSLLAALLHSQ